MLLSNITTFQTKLLIFLLFLFFFTSVNCVSNDCAQRCSRLLTRSLKQINFSVQKVENLFKAPNLMTDFGKICWKFYDFADCEKQCEKNPHRSSEISARLEMLKNLVLKRCKFMDKEYSQDIRCIHKYHSFLEIRCSSYLNEAVKLRKNIKENKKAKVQETCRFLHYHNTCLSNTVFFYCPAAKKFFNRFTLRDYFLSFIIPDDDEAFSDEFLDYCQIFDFHKIAKDVYDTTSSLKSEEYYDEHEGRKTTSIPIVKLLDDSEEKEKGETTKKVFSSQEDLKETPPEFFYSSARFETTTYQSIIGDKSQTKSKPVSSNDWSPKPVNIDFVSYPINNESEEPKPSDASSLFTINPNELLSTIFRIPEVFPTVSISPDPTTETTSVDIGSSVELLSPTSSEENDDFFDDNETTWITRTITPKNVKAIENSTKPSLKEKILETNKTKPKLIVSSTTSKPIVTTTTSPDKLLKPANKSDDKIVQLLGSYEVLNSSEIILDNSFFNETKEIIPLKGLPSFIESKKENVKEEEKDEEKAKTTTTLIPKVKVYRPNTTVIPIKTKPDPVYHNYRKFSSKENAKPFLSGTKIHIIPIQHYSKEEMEESTTEIKNNSDKKNDEESRDELLKSNDDTLSPQLEPFDISYPINTAPTEILQINPKLFDSTSNYDNTILKEEEEKEIELFNTSSLKWIIIGYFLLFITALGIIVYLLIAIITKKCKKRRKSYIISG
uniref:Uncharacterized protein n=1 Tax=Panagrolaimus sp. PS1159 TaxID=55785 RepID=A0AC35FMR6_9BILA